MKHFALIEERNFIPTLLPIFHPVAQPDQRGAGTMGLGQERVRFLAQKAAWADHARQTAAMQLLCGIDLTAALGSCAAEKEKLAARIRRLMERERMRGINRHWSYDLNRHIALKQALDRLVAQPSEA